MKPEDMDDRELSHGIAEKRAAVDGTGNFMHYASGLLALGGLFAIGATGLPFIASVMTVGAVVFGLTIGGALIARGRVKRLHDETRPLQAEQEDRFANPGKHMKKLTEKFERSMKSGVDKDIKVKKPLQIKKPQP
ncbi:MAG: phage holin family protein [Alphaproteobacteria bacterium]